MKNSGMSVPIQLAASVVVSEVLTPVISEIRLRGSNQENTNVIFLIFMEIKWLGQHLPQKI